MPFRALPEVMERTRTGRRAWRGVGGRVALAGLLINPAPAVAPLKPETERAWRTYVEATEARRAQELGDQRRFLAMDFVTGGTDARRALLSGRVDIAPIEAVEDGQDLAVPGGLVHHWRGAVFIPNATLSQVMATLTQGPPQ